MCKLGAVLCLIFFEVVRKLGVFKDRNQQLFPARTFRMTNRQGELYSSGSELEMSLDAGLAEVPELLSTPCKVAEIRKKQVRCDDL